MLPTSSAMTSMRGVPPVSVARVVPGGWRGWYVGMRAGGSVGRFDGTVEVRGRQHGEDVGLQHDHQDLEERHDHCHQERERREDDREVADSEQVDGAE